VPIAGWILSGLGVLMSATPLAASNVPEGIPLRVTGVRPTTSRLGALIDEATARSPTFKSLIIALEGTDGMVFVEDRKCPRPVPACLIWQLTLAGPYRVLFVVIDTHRPDIHLMASIGHELHHALEILGDPSIRTTRALMRFYLREGTKVQPLVVETAAAQAAGDTILREIQQSGLRQNIR